MPGVPVGVSVGVEGVPPVPAGATVHPVGLTIVSAINVTAPAPLGWLAASKRPVTVAPLFTVMDAEAKMVPMKFVVVSMVAELPTVQ